MPTRKSFPNPFAFFGQANEQAKVRALMTSHMTGVQCATDMDGNPQAYFRLPVLPNLKVLGRPGVEEIPHKPIKMLEAPK